MNAIIEEKIIQRAPDVFESAAREHGLTWHAIPTLAEADALSIQRETGASAIVIGTGKYSPDFYSALMPGTLVQRFGVGYDAVPVDLCRSEGLIVGYTPGVLDAAVAEHALALMLALARNVVPSHNATKAGNWAKPAGSELGGKTLALLGFGNIARKLAVMARVGLGMRVIAFGRRPDLNADARALCDEYTTDLSKCLSQADFISLHLASNAETRKIVNADFLSQMKPSAYLINTARGALIDESALHAALSKNQIAGAALDVFTHEPYEPDGPDLRELANCLLSPHCGSNTTEANRRMATICANNVAAHFAGKRDEILLIPEFRP